MRVEVGITAKKLNFGRGLGSDIEVENWGSGNLKTLQFERESGRERIRHIHNVRFGQRRGYGEDFSQYVSQGWGFDAGSLTANTPG